MKKLLNNKSKVIVGAVIVYLLVVAIVFGHETLNEKDTSENNIIQENENNNVTTTVADTNNINIDVLTRYQLPTFRRMEASDENELVNNLQIIKKVESLGISEENMLYPEKNLESAQIQVEQGQSKLKEEKNIVVFSGSTSKELQEFIDSNAGSIISITSQVIMVEQTIVLGDNTYIQGNGVELRSNENIKYALFAEQKQNISVSGVKISDGFDYGMYVIDSSAVNVSECSFEALEQKPIVIVGDSSYITISDNVCMYNKAGGIYFDGNINYGIIENNTVSNNYGTSNWMAGIVLTNVALKDKTNIWETFDDIHHFPYKENLYGMVECPHNIIVRDNNVEFNNASGIYGDGAYLCYLTGNYVNENDKEGICLDYGSFGCYLSDNTFKANGRRMRQTDDDLRVDFVLDAGRMEDGSAKSKLPGVSLDNTAYNILINNTIMDNYGGGVKMVRTTVRCLIMENIIKENNLGANDDFHFFGMELGSAAGDVDSTDMDFTPSFENIICRNIISGSHYSGIFIGEDGYVNDIFDNSIMQPQMFAVECISVKFNSILNNISDKSVRNEYENLPK